VINDALTCLCFGTEGYIFRRKNEREKERGKSVTSCCAKAKARDTHGLVKLSVVKCSLDYTDRRRDAAANTREVPFADRTPHEEEEENKKFNDKRKDKQSYT
jgi:hypothetical protein